MYLCMHVCASKHMETDCLYLNNVVYTYIDL